MPHGAEHERLLSELRGLRGLVCARRAKPLANRVDEAIADFERSIIWDAKEGVNHSQGWALPTEFEALFEVERRLSMRPSRSTIATSWISCTW